MIDQSLAELKHITDDFVTDLGLKNYQDFEVFIEKREEVCNKISNEMVAVGNLDSNQRIVLANILASDTDILTRMNELKDEARDWIERNNQVKRQNNAYQAIYRPDSYFFDKKN